MSRSLPQIRPTLLSHSLSVTTPAYGGGEGFTIEPLTSTEKGDTANTVKLHHPNHLGTHIDLPRHFFGDGATLTDYPLTTWLFDRPVLMDVKVADGELIKMQDLPTAIPHDADLLLIRTGHERRRDADAYWQAGPGLSPELGEDLRAHFPNIRAVGVDLISITSRLRRDDGKAAHRAFLDPSADGNPIILIEDMALQDAPPAMLGRVLVSPFFFDDADGAPVTVWNFFDRS